MVYSENLNECKSCHGQKSSRPIWDPMPFWPGVYGENYHVSLSQQEKEGLDKFMKNQQINPRYSKLVGVDSLNEQDKFNSSARSNFNYLGTNEANPNAELSQLLFNLNLQSILADLTRTEKFDANKYALLAKLSLECQSDKKNTMELYEGFTKFVEKKLILSTENWTLVLKKKLDNPTFYAQLVKGIEESLQKEIGKKDSRIELLFRAKDHSDKYCSYLESQR